jgi:UDP-N-acetylmuramoylalanine--D-glutamate ligase
MNLDYLKDKKILILGFAREGQDTLQFLRRLFPERVIGVADQNEKILRKGKGLKFYLGKDYLKEIGDYDVVIKSPGIPPKVLPRLKKNQVLTSQAEIFFDNCPGKIIGVTGTKGKSTTSSLIYEVLKSGGLKAHLVGNIGQPVLTALFQAKPDDIFVYELSSHQLMGLKKSPHVAVFLNFYPEHLDYYKNINEYLRAKQNICRWQGQEDYFLFNPVSPAVRASAKLTRAKKIALDPKSLRARLSLAHWRLSLKAAIEVGRIFQIPETKIVAGLKKFKPLPHRLEFVGEFQDIKFYNDSLATIPEAAISALETLGGQVQTIFLGGFDRGLDFKNLARKIIESKVKNFVFFPTTGQKIWQEINRLNQSRFFNFIFTDKMKKAVEFAFEHTERGKICLLSPASPSFGVFKDYADRGNQFKKWIKVLVKK